MAAVGAIAAVAGTGLSIYGDLKASEAKAKAAELDAQLKNQQADELMSREAGNEQLIQQQSDYAQHEYGAQAASSGTENSGVGGILQIQKNTAITIANAHRDAAFKAQMLRSGADIATNLASDERTAGYITGAGTLLGGVTKLAPSFEPGSSKAKELPTVGSNSSGSIYGVGDATGAYRGYA